MCDTCRAENAKKRKEQRAADKNNKRYHCSACDYTASSKMHLTRHEKTLKHLHQTGAPVPQKAYMPKPAHMRFNIGDCHTKKRYTIQWTDEHFTHQERFSYLRRPKEEAMAEALARQAELRAQ